MIGQNDVIGEKFTLNDAAAVNMFAAATYMQGARVQVGLVPYEAKWWSSGDQPGRIIGDAGPWKIVFPTVVDLG